MKHIPTYENFLTESAIELVSMSDSGVSNYNKKATTRKQSDIETCLKDPDCWTDDITFKDKGGNVYFVDDLVGKEVKVNGNKFTVNESEELNEDFGTVALGILIAYAGINLLKGIANRVLGRWVEGQEQDPDKLKKIVAEIASDTATQTGTNATLLQSSAIKKELDDKIDSGAIKNLGQLRKFFEDYQKKQMK